MTSRTRTEREKMRAGESYNLFDPELAAEREKVLELLRRFNRTETLTERQRILRQLLGHLGRDSDIQPPFYCSYGRNTHIGDHVYLNWSCTIIDNNEVRIGNHVMIGPFVQIYTAAHPLQAEARIGPDGRPVVQVGAEIASAALYVWDGRSPTMEVATFFS